MPVLSSRTIYRRWVFANGWSEALGLGTGFVLGRAVAPALTGLGPAEGLLAALAAVILGTLLEGVLVGAAQEQVLRDLLPALPARAWTTATAIGAGAAWLIGMIPSTIMGFLTSSGTAGPSPELPSALQYGLAVVLGLVTGPILGSAQRVVLQRYSARARWWLPANAAAWAVGMPLIFLGMDLVPWDEGGLGTAAAIYPVCAVVGLVVGAIHGRVLLRVFPLTSAEEAP